MTQDQINRWMVEYAEAGYSVARIKSGDPLLFGRAVEELEALSKQAIPWEIVPGVSAGFAAAALAGIPLTGRITNSRVLFATRHRAKGDTSGLAGIGPDVTLVLYMPGRDYAAIQIELTANGWLEDARCLIASSLGSAGEKIDSCILGQLHLARRLPSPVFNDFLSVLKSGAAVA